jgi:hypothetical protein
LGRLLEAARAIKERDFQPTQIEAQNKTSNKERLPSLPVYIAVNLVPGFLIDVSRAYAFHNILNVAPNGNFVQCHAVGRMSEFIENISLCRGQRHAWGLLVVAGAWALQREPKQYAIGQAGDGQFSSVFGSKRGQPASVHQSSAKLQAEGVITQNIACFQESINAEEAEDARDKVLTRLLSKPPKQPKKAPLPDVPAFPLVDYHLPLIRGKSLSLKNAGKRSLSARQCLLLEQY